MEEFNLQDELIAKPITKENVSGTNVTLTRKSKYQNVEFTRDSWDGIDKISISSSRKNKDEGIER